MTHYITHVGSVLAAVGLSMMSLSCGGGEDKEKGKKGGGGASASLEKEIIGYWAPDKAEIEAMAKKEVGDDPNAAAMMPMIMAMLGNMAIEVTEDKVSFVGMGEAKASTYKIINTDKDAKTLTMEVTEEDGTKEETPIKVGDDKLTITKDEESMVFNRITKEEFEKRNAAAAEAAKALGGAGGIVPPGGDEPPVAPGPNIPQPE